MGGAIGAVRTRYLGILIIVGDVGEVAARHVAGLQLVEVLTDEEHLEGTRILIGDDGRRNGLRRTFSSELQAGDADTRGDSDYSSRNHTQLAENQHYYINVCKSTKYYLKLR